MDFIKEINDYYDREKATIDKLDWKELNAAKEDDLVLRAISGSGNSHNVIKAVDLCQEGRLQVIGMTGYDGGKLAKISDYQLHVPADDMQITEDLHMGFDHMIMQIFWKYLAAKNGKDAIYKINM
jgi:D-sedoheptulose 7-phosphate isomerase